MRLHWIQEFIPGMNDQETPFGIHKVVESYIPDDSEDYFLLR
jgi:hypothetical protein